MAEQVYYVENIVRRQGSRLHRAKSAVRHRFKQFIAGQRLLRNKKLPLTESQFKAEEGKIRDLVKAGVLALYLPDGTRITTLLDGRMVRMPKGGRLQIEGQIEVPKVAAKPAPAPKEIELEETTEPAEEQDLTVLPNIGPGRAKKLMADGIINYKGVVLAGVSGLVELLGVTEELAEDIVAAAKGM